MNKIYHDKIKEYVAYQFRFSSGDSDRIDEVVSNMCDRFDDCVSKGIEAEEAYKATIKHFGFFKVDGQDFSPREDLYKEGWGDICMVIATITVIFGALCILLQPLLTIIFTVLSLGLYAGSIIHFKALATGHKSEGDIFGYKFYLRKAFRFMKTDYVFYSINISFLLSFAICNLAVILSPNQVSLGLVLILGILTFIVCGVACTFISVFLYRKMTEKYYYLTGEPFADSLSKESEDISDDQK